MLIRFLLIMELTEVNLFHQSIISKLAMRGVSNLVLDHFLLLEGFPIKLQLLGSPNVFWRGHGGSMGAISGFWYHQYPISIWDTINIWWAKTCKAWKLLGQKSFQYHQCSIRKQTPFQWFKIGFLLDFLDFCLKMGAPQKLSLVADTMNIQWENTNR